MSNFMKYALTFFTLGLVFFPPFFLGLYFEPEMSIHHYFAAAATLLVPVLLILHSLIINTGPSLNDKQKTSNTAVSGAGLLAPLQQLVTSPYFLALAALAAAYGISFLQAINPREALFAWLRHIDYLLTFMLVFLAVGMWKTDRPKAGFGRWMLIALTVSGTAIAAAGILAAQGTMPLQGGVTGSGRLASTFQYPNSLAAYLTAIVLLTTHLAVRGTRAFQAGAYAAMGFIIYLSMLGTQSRGAWLLLPLILLVFILGQTERKKHLLFTAVALGLALLLSGITLSPQVQQSQPNWGALFMTLAGCLVAGAAWGIGVTQARKVTHFKNRNKLNDRKIRRKKPANAGTNFTKVRVPNKAALGAICILLVIAAGVVIILNNLGKSNDISTFVSPELKRITHINTTDSNFQGRLLFYRDAFRMIQDRPLFGWGGGGWKSGYAAYQSVNYTTTVVHSHFMQVWIEAGTLGLAMFTIPFLLLGHGFISLYRRHKTYPSASETWTVGTAALALGLHAAIDFDLSFSSMSLLLWALLALFAYREKMMGFGLRFFRRKEFTQDLSKMKGSNGKRALGLTVSLIVCFTLAAVHLAAYTFILNSAAAKAQDAAQAAQEGDTRAALALIQEAARWDRWSARYPMLQARLLTAGSGVNSKQSAEDYAGASLDLARRAVKLDSYNPDNRFFLARLYLTGGQPEKALAEAEQGKKLKPWFIQTCEEFNSILVDIAVQQLLRGQEEAGVHTLRRVLAVTREAVTKKEMLPTRLQSLWDTRRDLDLTPALALSAGRSALLLEDEQRAREYLSIAARASDEKTKTLAQLWLGAALQKAGDPSGEKLIAEALKSGLEAEKNYTVLKQLVKF